MNDRPHPLALETYEFMLAYHSLVMGEISARDRPDDADGGTEPLHMKFEQARNGHRLAAKLIGTWHKDVAGREASEAAQRAAILARYRKAQ